MIDEQRKFGGVVTHVVGDRPGQPLLILLHGYAMRPCDLAPFASSLRLPVTFLFPRGPVQLADDSRAWWPIDAEARVASLQGGPRDLVRETPAGLESARLCLRNFLDGLIREYGPRKRMIGGFSQGGMLACDYVLHYPQQLQGLILLSSSRINFKAWRTRDDALRGLPIFISHGRGDPDLAFRAGEGLRQFATDAGGRVTWTAFDGGHEIPLPVWRGLRKFITTSL